MSSPLENALISAKSILASATREEETLEQNKQIEARLEFLNENGGLEVLSSQLNWLSREQCLRPASSAKRFDASSEEEEEEDPTNDSTRDFIGSPQLGQPCDNRRRNFNEAMASSMLPSPQTSQSAHEESKEQVKDLSQDLCLSALSSRMESAKTLQLWLVIIFGRAMNKDQRTELGHVVLKAIDKVEVNLSPDQEQAIFKPWFRVQLKLSIIDWIKKTVFLKTANQEYILREQSVVKLKRWVNRSSPQEKEFLEKYYIKESYTSEQSRGINTFTKYFKKHLGDDLNITSESKKQSTQEIMKKLLRGRSKMIENQIKFICPTIQNQTPEVRMIIAKIYIIIFLGLDISKHRGIFEEQRKNIAIFFYGKQKTDKSSNKRNSKKQSDKEELICGPMNNIRDFLVTEIGFLGFFMCYYRMMVKYIVNLHDAENPSAEYTFRSNLRETVLYLSRRRKGQFPIPKFEEGHIGGQTY